MKKLTPAVCDDIDVIDQLISSDKANISYVLKYGRSAILHLYEQYDVWVSQPQVVASQLKHLGCFSHLMVAAYSDPPLAISGLKLRVQRGLSPNVCPMCGSLKTGTADHYFPKEDFPEFSFYSKNLVPACDCNTKRGSALTGAGKDEWIIHPFYESAIQSRIITIDFDFAEEIPTLSIGTLYPAGLAKERVDFHISAIHRRTTMLDWARAEWMALVSDPRSALSWFPSDEITEADLRRRIGEVLQANDRKLGTPNNWTSALFSGVLGSREALFSVLKAFT